MSGKFQGTFLGRLNNKVFYISVLALVAVTAIGLFLSFDNANTVSAQKGDLASRDSNKARVATPDMLAFALRFGTSADYTVFGAKGVRGDGASVTGKSGTGTDEASLGENGSGLRARSDLNKAMSMTKQLPCVEMDTELTGGTFAPGVYCAPSAALAGQMVLDAGGDENGRFVFLIEGSMKSSDSFQMDLANGTRAGNVYFLADTASLGAWNSMSGSVIARGTVTVGEGTSVKGRAISKEGEVVLADGANLALAPGYIQICKYALHDNVIRTTPGGAGYFPQDLGTSNSDLDPALPVAASLRNRIFRFSINGGPLISVAVGQCSAPQLVATGATATITEANDGYYTHLPQDAANQWTDRFRLVNVSARDVNGANVSLGSGNSGVNLRTRTATVPVPTGDSSAPVIVDFVNTFAIPGVIEICKHSANSLTTQTGTPVTPGVGASVPINDIEVSGTFEFTVNVIQGSVFSVPVGFCTGPIFLDPLQNLGAPTTPQTFSTANPASAVVYVSEIGQAGYTLETMTAFGGNGDNRKLGDVFGQRVTNNTTNPNNQDPCAITTNTSTFPASPNCITTPNTGGGYQWGRVYEGGTPANQTIFSFFNRTNPGIIKVCKIAGPGIPVGTPFEFFVAGRADDPLTPAILPGTDIFRFVVVNAGPADQGGNCVIVSNPTTGVNDRFIVGTMAFVQETRVLADIDGVEHLGYGDAFIPHNAANDGPDTTPNSEVIVSRIRLNGSSASSPTGMPNGTTNPACILNAFATGCLNPNPNLPARQVIFRVNKGETVIEYTNILFRPTQLKICKVAASPSLVGTPFTFIIDVGNEDGLVPVNAQNTSGPTWTNHPSIPTTTQNLNQVTIPAGDPTLSSQGNCVIVNGPYGPAPGFPIGYGTFRVGSVVSVQEVAGSLVSITSPTGTPIVDLNNRRAFLTMVNPGGFNELVFTNTQPGGQPRPLTGTGGTTCAGTQTQISVSLASQGDEISINFIVQFDQTKLANPVVSLGSGAAGFNLVVDNSNVGIGQVGVTLTSPTNTPLVAGIRELIKINFLVLALASGQAQVTFGGPTQTLTTTGGAVLPTLPGSASVTITPPQGCTTSADVTVTGRVMSQEGAGLRNATVTITGSDGQRRIVSTSSLGYYQIDDVKAGDTYVITASAKRYRFEAKVMQVSDGLSNVNFVGLE